MGEKLEIPMDGPAATLQSQSISRAREYEWGRMSPKVLRRARVPFGTAHLHISHWPLIKNQGIGSGQAYIHFLLLSLRNH